MATDIAFSLGVLALLGRRVPSSLRLFLLSLAIVDDIGAILVIALVYSDGVAVAWLGIGAVCLAGVLLLARTRSSTAAATVLGAGAWLAVLQSGVHPTIAGVALGLVVPAGPAAERFEQRLHPVTSFVVMPVFALANAGVTTGGASAGARVAFGVALGLAVGKTVGISAASWLAVRARVGSLPDGASWLQVVGVALVAGVGFTVALFIADLAFTEPALVAGAKAGVLAGSAVAACASLVLLVVAARR